MFSDIYRPAKRPLGFLEGLSFFSFFFANTWTIILYLLFNSGVRDFVNAIYSITQSQLAFFIECHYFADNFVVISVFMATLRLL